MRCWRGDWYEWDGRRYATVGDDALAAELTKFLQAQGHSVTGKVVSDVLVNLRGMAHIKGEQGVLPPFRVDPDTGRVTPANVFVFSNGMVDLDQLDADRPLKVAPHDPRIFAVSELPYAFDAQATCPRWRKFLDEVLPKTADDDRRQRVLQEFFGYTLLRDCRYERLLIMLGAGRNGKSTIMNIWDAMLGAANVSNVPLDRLGSDAHLLELAGKLANFSRDLNHLSRTDEGRIKQLVSGEPITVDRKYKTAVTTVTRAKLIVACNELPDFSDPSLGIWRRMVILPFDVVIDESSVDLHLTATLREELPGILNWALRGLLRLLRRNRFTSCARCVNAVATHRQNSCSVQAFFAACCVRSPRHECLATNLYQLYRVWCQGTGRYAVRDTSFGRRFLPLTGGRHRGAREGLVRRPWVYRGVRLSCDATPFVSRLSAHPAGTARVERPIPVPPAANAEDAS